MKKLISGIILLLASFLVFAENTAIELAVEAMCKSKYKKSNFLLRKGCKQGLIKAIGWYRKAAAQGDQDAIERLEQLGMN